MEKNVNRKQFVGHLCFLALKAVNEILKRDWSIFLLKLTHDRGGKPSGGATLQHKVCL